MATRCQSNGSASGANPNTGVLRLQSNNGHLISAPARIVMSGCCCTHVLFCSSVSRTGFSGLNGVWGWEYKSDLRGPRSMRGCYSHEERWNIGTWIKGSFNRVEVVRWIVIRDVFSGDDLVLAGSVSFFWVSYFPIRLVVSLLHHNNIDIHRRSPNRLVISECACATGARLLRTMSRGCCTFYFY